MSDADLKRLMGLTIEAFNCAAGSSQRLLDAYMALAAECGFELWSRGQDLELPQHPAFRSITAQHLTSRSLN
jgi:hypothetical protein